MRYKIAFMLLILLLLVPSIPVKAEWLSGWAYRVPVTIDNTQNSNSLTDYQVPIVLDTASLISQGKMRSDCGDIRVTNDDGITKLSYWIECGCNTANTKVWVKVPSIPAGGKKTIYVYYGNPSATSQSNITNVFIFGDDFESGNLNKWTIYTGTTASIVYDSAKGSNVLKVYDTANQISPVAVMPSITAGFVIELDIAFPTATAGVAASSDAGICWYVTDNKNGYLQTIKNTIGYTGGEDRYKRVAGTWSVILDTTVQGIGDKNWHKIKMEILSNDWRYYIDSVLKVSGLQDTTFNQGKIGLRPNVGTSTTYYYYYDNIFVRKFIPPEPTVTVGAEEHAYPPSIFFADFAFPYNFEGYLINATAKYSDVVLFNGSTYDYYTTVNETARNFFKTVKLQGAPWKWKINATAKGAGGTVSSVKTLTVVALLFDDFTFTYNYDGYRIYATGYNVDSVMFNGSRYDSAIPADSGTRFEKTIRLPAGIWKINATATGLGKTTTVVRTVTVNKAVPTLNLYLNGKSGDIAVSEGEKVNITAFETNKGDDDATYCLYMNGSMLGCASRIVSTLQPSAGKYKIEYRASGCQNYTANSVSYTLSVVGRAGKSAEETPPIAVSPPPAIKILPPLAGLQVVISLDDPAFLFLLIVFLLVILAFVLKGKERIVIWTRS
ncbi:MAG: DUF2341 domain-containing protein [Candidatus Methanodesulfokora sp.]